MPSTKQGSDPVLRFHTCSPDGVKTGMPSSSFDGWHDVVLSAVEDKGTCPCVSYSVSRNRNGGKNHGAVGTCKHLNSAIATRARGATAGTFEKTHDPVCVICHGDGSTPPPPLTEVQLADLQSGLATLVVELEN